MVVARPALCGGATGLFHPLMQAHKRTIRMKDIEIKPIAHGAIIMMLMKVSRTLLRRLIDVRGEGEWLRELRGELRLFARQIETSGNEVDTIEATNAAYALIDEVFATETGADLQKDRRSDDQD